MATARVLLVEDEGLIRMVMADCLQDAGFQVVEAVNGDEAACLLDSPNGFDVLFTDVRMPGKLDGMDLVSHARRRYPAIPVLVVSGYAAEIMNRLASLAPPPAMFISKPYDIDLIVTVVRRLALNN